MTLQPGDGVNRVPAEAPLPVRRHVRQPGRERRDQRHGHASRSAARPKPITVTQARQPDQGRHATPRSRSRSAQAPPTAARRRDRRSRSSQVPGEQKTDNNTQTYTVLFTLARSGASGAPCSLEVVDARTAGHRRARRLRASRWSALVVAVVALVRLRRAARRPARAARRGPAERPRRARRAPRARSSASLHAYVGDVAARLDGRLGTAEDRLDGAIAYRGLVRYDAYNEMSGRQSCSIALLDAAQSGIVLSSIHHRDQARLYAKHVVDGEAEFELSPEEAEAVRLALAGEPPPEPPPAAMTRSATSARRGRSRTRRCWRRARAAGAEARAVRRPSARRSSPPQAGEVDAALVPIENSLEGGVNATLDTLAFDAPARAHRRRGGAPDLATPDRARPASALDATSRPSSRTRRPLAQCRRFLRRAAARPARRWPRPRRPRRSARVAEADAPRRRDRHRAPPPSSTAARCCARASRTSTATRRASSGSRRRRTAGRCAGAAGAGDAGRRRSSSTAPATPRPAGSCAACRSSRSAGINLARIESRPLKRRLGHYLFLVDLEGREGDPEVAEAMSALRADRGEPRIWGSTSGLAAR